MSESQSTNGNKTKSITDQPLSASQKVYVHSHAHPDVSVAMRAVSLSSGAGGHGNGDGAYAKAPVMIYDTSGPYTDPSIRTDIRRGLKPIRLGWIKARGDVEDLAGPS